jgi:hypothetical protein
MALVLPVLDVHLVLPAVLVVDLEFVHWVPQELAHLFRHLVLLVAVSWDLVAQARELD